MAEKKENVVVAIGSALVNHLAVTQESYDACLSSISHDLKLHGIKSTLRFHHLVFDKNGEPKLDVLIENLANYLTSYCLTSERRAGDLSEQDRNSLYRQAKKLLRDEANSGEAGELLLYFLTEAVLKAPQAVAKVSLKTNPRDEIKGSDGIHVGWSEEENCLVIYFGESKIYTQVSSAIDSAVSSINSFYKKRLLDHEIFLVSSHFNLLNPVIKTRILNILDKKKGGDYKVVHTCLFGFDWSAYSALNTPNKIAFIDKFAEHYLERAKELASLLQDKSKNFDDPSRLCLEVFFLPFSSVADFRGRLLKEL